MTQSYAIDNMEAIQIAINMNENRNQVIKFTDGYDNGIMHDGKHA